MMTQESKTTKNQKKAVRRTAVILAVVALGFFAWSVFIVLEHAKG
jgi:hypothetical protein